jgi:hypothetical protein
VSSPRPPGEGPDDAEVDRAFAQIVAGLRSEGSTSGVNPPWPPEAPADRPAPQDPAPQSPPPQSPPPPQQHLGPGTPEGMATDHRSYEPPEEDDHFVPPPPPPLPAGDLHFWGIVVGLVLGPALVVLSAVIPALGAPWAFVGAVLAVGGFVLLVLRQPRRRGLGDGDDGARV